jgi:hypothetical protein
MGFFETYGYILSYFGIGLLGLGILISIVGIVPACYWLFTSVSVNRGPVIFRRILVMIAVIFIASSYVRSPSFYEAAGWWKTTFFAAFLLGFFVPVLRMDLDRLDRRADRGIAMISCLWWGILVFSEALLISGVIHQAMVLYLFVRMTGILSGSILGTTFARTARQKIAESTQTAEAP